VGLCALVGYNEDLELVPDILKDVDVEDGRIFTLHTREGHKWSDGHPSAQKTSATISRMLSAIPSLTPLRPAAVPCWSTARAEVRSS
jgi:peptide/nickel transport system substrate-binding protein